ncbi:hypothetical protein AMECASPLE_029967 [Ameca splendens]|uniref:Uncharacterized protein n=1 Tax=Ameca splendens TaxID=208324 RepID=A0ABV0Y650_9TELE
MPSTRRANLMRLRSFKVCTRLLRRFLSFCGSPQQLIALLSAGKQASLTRTKRRLKELVWRSRSVRGCPLEEVGERRMLPELASIEDNAFCSLHQTVKTLNSSMDYKLCPICLSTFA